MRLNEYIEECRCPQFPVTSKRVLTFPVNVDKTMLNSCMLGHGTCSVVVIMFCHVTGITLHPLFC